MTLACCFCGDKRWDAPTPTKVQIRLQYPLGRMRQWFGCHEDCLARAMRGLGERSCSVCGEAAGTAQDIHLDVQDDVRGDCPGWVHRACLQTALATGFDIELDPDEPLYERDGDA